MQVQVPMSNQPKNDGLDRRRFPRVDKNIAIKLKDKEVDFVTETKNISCMGAYCLIDTYLPILTKLLITLLIPKSKNAKAAKHITCEGTVVRVERANKALEGNMYNVAIYFNQISKRDMKLIDGYIKYCITRSP